VRVKDDDNNPSNAFNLSILINTVNDAPEITQMETTTLMYEPGTDPIALTATLKVEDVDNDHISFAAIKFSNDSYNKGFDELLFSNTNNIRGVFDIASGELSLLGYATLAEYDEAIRSVTYNYILVKDEIGNESEIPPGLKTILLEVHDGQQASEPRTRNIMMETTVSLDIPTAFSPNGDGANETWNVHALSNANRCENAIVKVYDKRGLLLFQAIGISEKWDGRFNGTIVPSDAYFYTIDLKLRYSKKTYSGVVTILR
jgi:gliding motility-associated-like protein